MGTGVSRATSLALLVSLTGCIGPLRQLRSFATKCIDVPDPNATAGRIIEGVVPSRSWMKAPVGYALSVPRGRSPREIDRVVYVLPGRGGKAVDTLTWLGYAGFAQELIDAGAAPFAILALDSGETYYHPRTSGEDRLAIVERDLPALAHQLLAPNITYEAIVGQSMGGYGALLAAERHPERFRAVGVAGPALFQTFAEENHAIGDGFDNARQFANYDVIGHAARLANVPVMVRIGYADPFLANAKAFARRVPHADVAYVERGCHTDGFWRATAHELLAFVTSR
jgi:pimeloyl-ACP methyl ester carboxylesterase